MIYNLAHNGNKLITFTIDGTTYQAIDGMTWEEWVNSEYNTRSFLLSGEREYIIKIQYLFMLPIKIFL